MVDMQYIYDLEAEMDVMKLLQAVSDKGITDAEWHLIMASDSFNLQLYAEAVNHAEQANTIVAGCADDMLALYSQYD